MIKHRTYITQLIAPLLLAISAISFVELAVQLSFHPTFWDKTTWLMHDPYRGELFDRVVVSEKLSNLLDVDADIISVGDSSGFFSLQPQIVNRYLHGKKYINLSTGANQAYGGYRAIAEFALRHSPRIKYVVLYIYPQLGPIPSVVGQGGLSPILQDTLVGLQSHITPPSALFSPHAKFRLFEARDYHVGDTLSNHKVYLEFHSTVKDTLGWVPEHDIRFDRFRRIDFYPVPRNEWYDRLGITDASSFHAILGDFRKMVKSYGAELVIAFAPFPAGSFNPQDENVGATEREFERFQMENADVKFLFPFITAFSSEKFGQFNHIAREYVFLSSSRLGAALDKVIRDPASVSPFHPAKAHPTAPPQVEFHQTGSSDSNLRNAAMSYFLYTATADERYRELISSRVLDLVDHNQAFRFMMQDTRERGIKLGMRGITLSYDITGLQAIPVEIHNLPHCNASVDIQWVQLGGTVNYSFASTSPIAQSTEPVAWPESSHLFVPTVLENGVHKFDGYCPEPALNAVPSLPE
jgi:hypothetical protein